MTSQHIWVNEKISVHCLRPWLCCSHTTGNWFRWDSEACIKEEIKEWETWDEEKQISSSRSRMGEAESPVCCGSMMIFQPEQTGWASQRRESIDLPGSNHNTSTFPLVYSLAFYQDFINYFGWQIDLLLCPLCVCRVPPGVMCVCMRACMRAYVNVSAWTDMLAWLFVCRLLCRHHLPSGLKVQGPHGGKANVTGQASQCQVPTDDVRRSPRCCLPQTNKARRRVPSLPDPSPRCRSLLMMGFWWSRN